MPFGIPICHSNWYLEQHPEVAGADLDPITHYVRVGAALGLNPCRWFCTKTYLQTYPDVAAAKVNPFTHYVQYGRYESRRPGPDNYAAWIATYDVLTDPDRAVFRRALNELSSKPLISVVMPVHDTDAEWLRRSIESRTRSTLPLLGAVHFRRCSPLSLTLEKSSMSTLGLINASMSPIAKRMAIFVETPTKRWHSHEVNLLA